VSSDIESDVSYVFLNIFLHLMAQ